MSSVRFARRHLLHFLIGTGALVPATAAAQVAQEKVFFNTLFAACAANAVLPSPNPTLDATCLNAFPGGVLAGGAIASGATVANVGSTGSYARPGQAGMQRQLEDEEAKKKRKAGGGSGDFTAGPFGGTFTVQRSLTTRALTDLENGYNSRLDGFLVGLDRRFGNDLVIGLTVGRSDIDSNYLNNGGTMSARNTTAMLYTMYLPAPTAYLGAYLGGGRGSIDATRRIAAGSISGMAASSTNSSQTLGGLSGGYNWYSGALTFALTGAVDTVRNHVDATTESGTTGLEFMYPETRTSSLTSTLGTRASYRWSSTWGAIAPSIRVAAVHEYKDNARTVSPSLVISPSTTFAFQTDAPDRDYYIKGVGATLEIGRGTQLFVDYEKRGGHRFIDTWAASAGAIIEF